MAKLPGKVDVVLSLNPEKVIPGLQVMRECLLTQARAHRVIAEVMERNAVEMAEAIAKLLALWKPGEIEGIDR